MNLLFVLFSILLLIYLSCKRYGKVFNPFSLSIFTQLLFLVVPQLIVVYMGIGSESTISNMVILIYVLSVYFGTYIKIPSLRINDLNNKKSAVKLTIVLVLLLMIPMIPILLSFGISLRGLREFYEYVVFSSYASLYEIIKTLLYVLIIFIVVRNRRVTISLLFICFILCFSGSKMAILSTVIILCTIWEEYFKINYKALFLILISVFVLMLFYHYSQTLYNEDKNAIDTAISYFDIYRQQSYALDLLHNEKLDFFYGEIWLTSWYKVIPRLIWEDKPKEFGFALLNYAIYPEYASDGYMPSFGLAYLYADFGYLSVIVFGMITGAVKNYFRKIYYVSHKNEISCMLYILEINPITIVLLIMYNYVSSLKSKK